MHYTPAQTRWFLAAIDRAEREALAASVTGARMAQAEPKYLKPWLDALAKAG